MKRIYFLRSILNLLACIFSTFILSQQFDGVVSHDFETLRKKYMKYDENEDKAFNYLNIFIHKAKSEHNYDQLSRAYIDAIYFSSDQKLIYADSAIAASFKTKKKDFIARAYLAKGSVYYFNHKQYQKALFEYLESHKYAEEINDKYLQNRIDYQLAIVKGYLGYDQEAVNLLKNCITYFEYEFNKREAPLNLRFNHQKGYLNSLNQLINSNYSLGNYETVDSLLQLGLSHTPSTEEFRLEQSYFYKWKGIRYFDKKEYEKSIYYLEKAFPEIDKLGDFVQGSIVSYYLGKCFINSGEVQKGYVYLNKIDSIFNENHFILPELRETYELLIEYHKNDNNLEQQLYYTNQLLKADDFFISDFRYLSQKINKDYDTRKLQKDKDTLVSENKRGIVLICICLLMIIILFAILKYQYKRVRIVKNNYRKLVKKMHDGSLYKFKEREKNTHSSLLSSELTKEILQKLAFFETGDKFLDNALTQAKLANSFKTNTTYLSQTINEYKGVNFNEYINTLRINYITKLLYNDKTYLNYSVEALAQTSGFSSRQVFSNVFFKINKVRPKDFINNRKEEISNSKKNVKLI